MAGQPGDKTNVVAYQRWLHGGAAYLLRGVQVPYPELAAVTQLLEGPTQLLQQQLCSCPQPPS